MVALLARVALGEDLVVDGVDVVLAGTATYDAVVVTNGGRILVRPLAQGGGALRLEAASVRVDAGSAIVAVGAGHPGVAGSEGQGPGGGGPGGFAGGGGGAAGTATPGWGLGCAEDGLAGDPSDGPGSAGGGVGGAPGGAGGGEVTLVAQRIDLRGTIDASGEDGTGGAGGGGGGRVTLLGDQVSCSGGVVVRGGSGGGGGAGGAVSVGYDALAPACPLDVAGGTGGCGCPGGEGTVEVSQGDWDGDGATAKGGDCATADPDVVPGAGDGDCDGADDDCDGRIDEDTSTCGGCDRLDRGGASTWLFCPTRASYDEGLAACEALGAYTGVTVGDEDEDAYVGAEALTRGAEWFLGYDDRALEGDWRWRSGLPVTFAGWGNVGEPQPNQFGDGSEDADCTTLSVEGWRDTDCSAVGYPIVCESCPARTVYADADGDGWGDLAGPEPAGCAPVPGTADRPGDCDDDDAAVHPAALEVCDGLDQDCDGRVDEAPIGAWADEDGDGWGDAVLLVTCDAVPAWSVPRGGDCDDADEGVSPEATETCDGVDQDCDGAIDEGLTCAPCLVGAGADGQALLACFDTVDGSDLAAACAARGYVPIALEDSGENEIVANLLRALGQIDTWIGLTDAATEGTFAWSGTGQELGCGYAHWVPGSPDNGGGLVQEDCVVLRADEAYWWEDRPCTDDRAYLCEAACARDTRYADADGDGFGAGGPVEACTTDRATAGNALDCDDVDALVHPAAPEVAGDGIDQDCDGLDLCLVDADGDGFGTRAAGPCADVPPGDCDDDRAGVHPGAPELEGDGVDQDCDCADVCWRDGDGDGVGADPVRIADDVCGEGFAAQGGDCDDDDPEVTTCGGDALASEDGLSGYLPCGCASGRGGAVPVLALVLVWRRRR